MCEFPTCHESGFGFLSVEQFARFFALSDCSRPGMTQPTCVWAWDLTFAVIQLRNLPLDPVHARFLGATVHIAMGQTVCFISLKMHYRLCLYYCFSVKELLLPTNSEAQITIMFKKQMFPKNHTHFSEKLKNWKNHTHFSENSRFPRIVHLSRQERTRYVSKIQ